MSQFRHVIFDLAGTTVQDTNTVGECLQVSLAEVGLIASLKDVNSVMGIPKPIAIQTLLDRAGQAGDVSAIHDRFRELMLTTYRTSPEVTEIDGASEVFRALAERGLIVSVDTGFDREITDVVLERMQWGELVIASIASDEVERGRPYPDMILELCRRLDVTPAQSIKVGDTLSDLQEGAAAGVGLNVGVLYGTHTQEELEQGQPDLLLSSLRELLSLPIYDE